MKNARGLLLAPLAAVVMWALAAAPAASAHAELLRATPASDAVVTAAPVNVVLQFGEDILTMASNIITVIGPDGSQVDNGNTLVNGDTAAVGLVDITDAGSYTVTYRIASADGHVVTDSYSFQFQPPAGYSPAPDATAVITPATEGKPGSGKPAVTTKILFIAVFGGALWWASKALRSYRRKALERRPF